MQRRRGTSTVSYRGAAGAVCMALLLPFGAGWAQQNLPSVPANIDDPGVVLQRREPAAQDSGEAMAAPEDFDQVQLTPGSLVSMNVTDVPELSGMMLRIDPKGDVSVPTLGPVHIAGMTVPAAQDAIARALVHGELYVNPAVRLSVEQFTAGYISVLGEVQTPGRFRCIGDRDLSDVLASAGGETLAAGSDIEIQRASRSGARPERVHYTATEPVSALRSIAVHPGDTVYVRRAGVVYVLGAVNKPGGYLMVDGGGLSIFQALSLAGGTTLDAAKNGMYIIRPHGQSFQEIKVPFSKLAHEAPSELQLEVNDVLYLPRSGWRVTLLDGSAIIGAAVNGALYTAR